MARLLVDLRVKRSPKVEKNMERIETMRKISIAIAALTLVLALGCKNQNQ